MKAPALKSFSQVNSQVNSDVSNDANDVDTLALSEAAVPHVFEGVAQTDAHTSPASGAGQQNTSVVAESANQNVGLNTADLSALLNSTISSSPPPIDPSSQSATVGDKAVPLFTSSQLTPAVTVNATNPADVTFTVSGLQAGDHGTVTFTDAKGVQDVVNVGSNGNYTTNLSNLAIGMIDYTLSVTDPAGHVTTVDPTTSLGTVAGFALDANGWPIITPQSNSQIIYVSSSTGNDNNNGLTPQTAVATIAKGESLLRNGYPDHLLLKAGDTFVNQSFGDLNVSGQSATAPMVIGTYGTGPAPIVETTPNSNWGVGIGSLPGRGGNFLVVEGINFYDYTRDPSNPAYAGPNSPADTGADFLNPNTWVMLAGDKFSFYTTDLVFNSSTSHATSSTVTLYRNVVTNAWSATSHSQGLFVSGVGNLVIDQNVFDHDGWNASIPGAGATVFNRNVYVQFTNGPVTFTGNISANSSSEGAQFRSGGTISDNLFVADSAGFSVGENPNTSPPAQPPTITSAVATGNVILNSTEIQTSSGPQPRSDGIEIYNASGSGVQVTKNIIADAIGPIVNESGISLNNYVTGATATNNIIYNVANPIVDTGTSNTTSPNAINQTGYVNPNVSIGSYNASLGGNASLAAFMAAADNQSMTNWNPAYTAAAANSYIQAGFSTSGTPTTSSTGSTSTSTGSTSTSTGSTSTSTGSTSTSAEPTLTSVIESPATGDLNAGKIVTLTIKLSEAVTVSGGTPTLTLNDGGTATYSSGSGSNALTFSYTVPAGQNTSDLMVTGVKLNSATIKDSAGTAANPSLSGLTQSGPQIDTTAPTISSLVESPSTGTLRAGSIVTLTVKMSEAVAVSGGTPTLSLNDGGIATYTGGSGTNALTFSYIIGAGQSTSDLTVTAVNLNSATVTDGAGNAANLSLIRLGQSGPQIDTTATTTGSGSSSSPPATPTITSFSPDNGKASGGYTDAHSLTLIGTAAANSKVEVFDGSTQLGTTTVNGSGAWTYTTPRLSNGTQVFTAKDMNSAGDVSASSAAVSVTVVTAASVTKVGNNYDVTAAASDPPLKYKGANVTAGQFGEWAPISAVQTASGFDIAWKLAGASEYTVWTTDSNGDYTRNLIGTVSGNSHAWESIAPLFPQRLNSGGVTSPTTKVIQKDGSTSLTEVGNRYYDLDGSNGSGPVLKYKGRDVTAGEFGKWTPIGAIQTASGYDIAWKNTGTGQYTVWSTDRNGNYKGSLTGGAVSGASHVLEALEPVFKQDLNRDGVIGLTTHKVIQKTRPSDPTEVANHTTRKVIQKDGSTSLTEVANHYYELDGSNGSGPVLKYKGRDVTAGEFGKWTPIGAIQTASGYDIAWKNTGTGQYTVWSTDRNGNYKGSLTGGAVSGASHVLEALEPVFKQDLNRDGVIGLTTHKVIQKTRPSDPTEVANHTTRKVIQKDGSTSLTEVANHYYDLDGSNGSGPVLKYKGRDVTAGEFGKWTPIGAIQTASGYDIAWKNTGTGQYTVWSTDRNGNYKGSLTGGAVSGASHVLEALEPVFKQDLNRDGVIGLTTHKVIQKTRPSDPTEVANHTTRKVIQKDGSTSLTEVGNRYYDLDGSNGSGPVLKYKGRDVTAGEFGKWTPIGAIQTASGYDVAWKNTGTGQYTVWSTDRNGNYKGNIGAVSGTSYALESLEPVFPQDLNRDGVIGLYAARGKTLQISKALAGTSGSATIGAGATLELAVADSASVTFAGSTGTLRLDHSSTFSGKIFKFSGNGSLSGSDHIDLRDVKYSSVRDTYSNGILTVADGSGDSAKLSFNGSYTLANFKFANDGNGGTIVYDPPVPPASGQNTAATEPVAPSATTGAGQTHDPADPHGIAFNVQSTGGYLPDSNQAGLIPAFAEGTTNANIALLGNYMASSFAPVSHSPGTITTLAEVAHSNEQSVLSNPHHG